MFTEIDDKTTLEWATEFINGRKFDELVTFLEQHANSTAIDEKVAELETEIQAAKDAKQAFQDKKTEVEAIEIEAKKILEEERKRIEAIDFYVSKYGAEIKAAEKNGQVVIFQAQKKIIKVLTSSQIEEKLIKLNQLLSEEIDPEQITQIENKITQWEGYQSLLN